MSFWPFKVAPKEVLVENFSLTATFRSKTHDHGDRSRILKAEIASAGQPGPGGTEVRSHGRWDCGVPRTSSLLTGQDGGVAPRPKSGPRAFRTGSMSTRVKGTRSRCRAGGSYRPSAFGVVWPARVRGWQVPVGAAVEPGLSTKLVSLGVVTIPTTHISYVTG